MNRVQLNVTVDKAKEVHDTYVNVRSASKWKVRVSQVLKFFKFASKPEQPRLTSSIRLEIVQERTQLVEIGLWKWITKSQQKCGFWFILKYEKR